LKSQGSLNWRGNETYFGQSAQMQRIKWTNRNAEKMHRANWYQARENVDMRKGASFKTTFERVFVISELCNRGLLYFY